MRRFASILALLGASACSLAPTPKPDLPPLPPAPAAQTLVPASGPAQAIVPGGALAADWWRAFASPALDALVTRALAANTDLAQAEATLGQAREQALGTAGASLPQVDASLTSQRTRVSRIFSNPVQDPNQYLYSLHTAQISVSYPLDLFGGQRSRVRSARAQAEVARQRLAAARTTVVANLVVAVVQQAALDQQIAAAEQNVQINQGILAMMRRRQALGDIGAADVAAQETALATAQSALPPLIRQRDHQRALISQAIGIAPGAPLPALPTLDELTLPGTVPVALPGAIVANRPDVRAAEAQMVGAAADVGTAIAARLPAIQLSANAGGEALHFADMFASGNPFWALIGSVAQPLFHGGQLRHQQRAAEAALRGAEAQYRGAVLNAFGDVADALTGLTTDAALLDAAARASDAAARNLLFARRQLALGSVGTLALLNATIADAQARSQLIQARAARLSDTVALYQAVGGGVAADAPPR
ncbi:efflux transporter outer membrane subunit [Sphingomonas morindae]|uniref:Efflux transporter outer membrane subunit n=1 Tax=Sphingomonas morindae TaxID=1541170 RepID=A0ABY4X4X1_9SPHN|nr:efflux transporter outer membrane subunit [Sphingomonas morindae]USI71949.1 efflux transporter outer membrane subunit [Sphingomonas morindae]